jgi:molecular chaperone GrpE
LELTVVNDEELKADSENLEPDDQAPLDSADVPIAEMVEDIAEAVEDLAEAEITLDTLHDELSQAKDAALRAQAEAQNARRRSEQDVERARKYALERFSGDLLTVVDNLERAAEAAAGSAEEAVKPIAEGVNLTLKSLLDVLGKYHIEIIDPVGEPFDPNLHQAMTMVPNPDMEPNTVMDVMQRGYSLSGRLLRPAMVIVSKAPD